MYILESSDGSYYTVSTKDLELGLIQQQSGEGGYVFAQPAEAIWCLSGVEDRVNTNHTRIKTDE